MAEGVYLNVGCGLVAPPDWINLDGSYSVLFAKHKTLREVSSRLRGQPHAAWPRNIRFRDIRRGLPLPDGAAAAVYASHFVEHLDRHEARAFTAECRRVLAPQGRVRFVVPDLLAFSLEYIEAKRERANGEAAERFMEALACFPVRESGSLPVRLIRRWKRFNVHKCLYDADSLTELLRWGGFSGAQPAGFLESGIARIASVEREDRFAQSICVEALKPC